MADRASPVEAVKRIAWELNYRTGEELSLNELAERTDLSWATARKYAQLLELTQKVAPEVEMTDDGIYVGDRSAFLTETLEDPEQRLAVYLLMQAEIQGEGDATVELDRESAVEQLGGEDILAELARLGWAERTEDTVRLTPVGVEIAGRARSAVESGSRDIVRGRRRAWQSRFSNAERQGRSADRRRYETDESAPFADDTTQDDDEKEFTSTISSAQAK